VQPKPLRNAAIAGVLGLIAAGAWAWWRTDRKTHVETREDPAYILEAPLLGVVPRFSNVGVEGPLPALDENQSQASEAYHFVASFVRLALERVGGKSVLITSTGVGDGKTITAANLVAAAVSDGSYPLLIDADERARGLTRLAGMERLHGITDLTLDGNPDRIIHTWTIGTTEILLVPAGTNLRGGAASYFRSAAFRQALPKLTVGRDLVVIDAPPILAVAETNDLATLVDGVIVVVRPRTPLKELDAARHQLELSGATILGYIYNGATAGTLGYGYGYGYGFSSGDGYGYGRGADPDAD
jgi:Mrp family chromosome partitioning ATPase